MDFPCDFYKESSIHNTRGSEQRAGEIPSGLHDPLVGRIEQVEQLHEVLADAVAFVSIRAAHSGDQAGEAVLGTLLGDGE